MARGINKGVSCSEVAVYQALAEAGTWAGSTELAARSGAAPHTVRGHMAKYLRMGLVDQAAIYPGHRWRLRDDLGEEARDHVARIEEAAEVHAAVSQIR